MADGAEFSIDLGVTGGDAAVSAASALDALASKLEVAGTAATAASNAMKAGQTAYDQAESAANRAALAVERIGIKADAQRGKLQAAMDAGDGAKADAAAAKLQNLVARQAEAVAKASSATAAMNAEAAALDKLKAAAASATDVESKLNKEHDKAAQASKAAAKGTEDAGKAAGGGAINFRALGAGLGKLGGPLGSIGSAAAGVGGAMQKLGKSLGAAGPYVAAAVLAVALATAFVAATLAITKFGVESADAARTSALLSDGIAGTVKGGRALDEAIYRIGNSVPLARDELVGMATDLAKTGLKGEDLSNALEEAATKAAKLKFGPDFAKQMLALPNQAARLKQNIAGVFSGLKIEGLLEGLSKLVALFDANSATGQALKVVFESMFQPVVDGLTGMIPLAVRTFIQLEILALKALIAIKPFGKELTYIGYAFAILGAACVVAVGLVIAILLAAVAVPALFIAAIMWAQDACGEFGKSIRSTIGGAVDWMTGKFNEVVAFLQGLSFSEIGGQLIQGLIDGITGGGAGVIKAIAGIAGDAVGAAKKALGIASPSKVFAEIGMHTAAGMEEGVDSGAPGVQAATEALVAPPDAAAASPAGSTSTSTTGGAVYNITIQGGGDAKSVVDALREYLAGLGVQAGTAVASAS